MSLIRSTGTKIEKKFLVAMRESGLKGYRINPKTFSKPDFSFGKYKVAVFCDGNFWHGKNYRKLRPKLKNEFWITKIRINMQRDENYTLELKKRGWLVLRFWESEINEDINLCLRKLKTGLKRRGYSP